MTCYNLFTEADGGLGGSPCSSVFQIASQAATGDKASAHAFSMDKIVVGKPMFPDDSYNTGYMATDYLASAIAYATPIFPHLCTAVANIVCDAVPPGISPLPPKSHTHTPSLVFAASATTAS